MNLTSVYASTEFGHIPEYFVLQVVNRKDSFDIAVILSIQEIKKSMGNGKRQ